MSIIYQKLIPMPLDGKDTPTSDDQTDVEKDIEELLTTYQHNLHTQETSSIDAAHVPVPTLSRTLHKAFLLKILRPLPSGYLGFDSSRCWLLYWVNHSLALMGAKQDEHQRTQAIATLLRFQNLSTGGFGSGHGQISHLMGSYASIMALAIVGGPGPAPDDDDIALGCSVSIGKGGWDAIDRTKMYDFLLSLKQADGSFAVHRDGEIDVRSIYCVLCISLILGIATPELLDGVGNAIATCQTYEGGLSASSQPFSLYEEPMQGASLGEAHGGYVYCAMAAHLALALLPNTQNANSSSFPSDLGEKCDRLAWDLKSSACSAHLDLDNVVRWAASQQGIPIEGGGFRGRTNKLVDGCYGWFSGAGLGTVLQALTELAYGQWWRSVEMPTVLSDGDAKSDGWESDHEVVHSDGYLFDRQALQEYILVIAQSPSGGLRDKPGKRSDAYHTCYNLSGLSLCQHRVHLDAQTRKNTLNEWHALPASANSNAESWRRNCYASMLSWTIDPKENCVLGDATNQLNITHPIFNIPFFKAKKMMDWAYGQS